MKGPRCIYPNIANLPLETEFAAIKKNKILSEDSLALYSDVGDVKTTLSPTEKIECINKFHKLNFGYSELKSLIKPTTEQKLEAEGGMTYFTV